MKRVRAQLTVGIDASCWLNRRGFGRYTRELVSALLALDTDTEYVLFMDARTARESPDLPPAERTRRVVVETTEAAAVAASAKGHRSFPDLLRMRRAVARHRELDVFYFPTLYTYFPIRTRAKVVVTKHDTTDLLVPDLIFPNRRSRFFWRAKVRLALRRADALVTVSETSKRLLCEAYRLRPERVTVVSDAVDPAFQPVADPGASRRIVEGYGVPADRPFLLYVGGISPHKNLGGLLDAFARLQGNGVAPLIDLVLVGDFEKDVFYSSFPEVWRRAQEDGFKNFVHFTGFVSDADLVHFYRAARLLVLPSFNEGFGLPAVEAMACGTPVAVSRVGALPEVVGDAGALFDPHDTAGMAACLDTLLRSPERLATMRARGIERAATFRWDRSARTARDLIRGLAAR